MATLKETLETLLVGVQLQLKTKIGSLQPEKATDSHTLGYIKNAKDKIDAFKLDIEYSVKLHGHNPYMFEFVMADKNKKIDDIVWSIDQIK